MKSDWILDVLMDLKNFALTNGLPVLASQLETTEIVAIAEIADEYYQSNNLDSCSKN